MGYGYYELPTPEGKTMRRGYSVHCKCHKKCCDTKIDRGLAYLCYQCTQYFCYEHLVSAYGKNNEIMEADCFAGKSSQVCKNCAQELRRQQDEDGQ